MRSVPGFPVFWETVSAIDRPALSWLEGDFALFSTIRTDCLCHFSGTEVSRATITLFFHCITHAGFDSAYKYFCQEYKYICIGPYLLMEWFHTRWISRGKNLQVVLLLRLTGLLHGEVLRSDHCEDFLLCCRQPGDRLPPRVSWYWNRDTSPRRIRKYRSRCISRPLRRGEESVFFLPELA